MSFIGELFSKVGGYKNYCVINVGGEYIYAEGVERLVSIADKTISFYANKKLVLIVGENLAIEDLDDGTIMVKGKIVSVEEK